MEHRTLAGDNGDEFYPGGSWRKSSYSLSNGQCVEAARLASGRIAVRDSLAAGGPILRFEPASWGAFLSELRIPPFFRS
jgi:Domain of unknown function (DUF397)